MEHYLVIALYAAAFMFTAGLVLYLLSCFVLYGDRKLSNAVDAVFDYGERVGGFGIITGAVMMSVLIPITVGMLLVQAAMA